MRLKILAKTWVFFEIESEPKPKYFLFGNDACRIYSEDGIEALSKFIESGEGHALYKYTGDVFDLLGNYSEWTDYAILSKDEYDKISER